MCKKSTTHIFIEKSIAIHGNRYDYSLVDYIGNKLGVLIICKEHGVFKQRPNDHLCGKGCIKCGIINNIEKRSLNIEEFIQRSLLIHNNKYDYSLVNYKNTGIKVEIVCKKHGIFEQTPGNHLSGHGCLMCAIDDSVKNRASNTEEFIQKSITIHNNKYNYLMVQYKNSLTKIKILCKEHGIFNQMPSAHLSGQGCPKCATTGFNPNKPAYFYYIKFESKNEQSLYKIGITNRIVKTRIWGMQVEKHYKPTILKEFYFKNGMQALSLEKTYKQQFKEFQYRGESIMANGNTELFIKDILGLDI